MNEWSGQVLQPDESDHIPDGMAGSRHSHIFSGDFFYRTDDGEVGRTNVLLTISSEQVTVRYGDGVEHVGRRGDDVVTFFASGLAPSLLQIVASEHASGPGESRQ